MIIGGLQKTSLIDFPNRICCVIFTAGCCFRCPFCHNKNLVELGKFNRTEKSLDKDGVLSFIGKRKNILDGVCITGGEPTLQRDLLDFCRDIKELGLEVKLDTNGSNPQTLKTIIEKRLANFIAMDIKTSFEEYEKAIGINFDTGKIRESMRTVLNSGLEYEFRTTVVPTIHNAKSIKRMAEQIKEIAGTESVIWFLQNFRPKNCYDERFEKIVPFTREEINGLFEEAQKIIPTVEIRGL